MHTGSMPNVSSISKHGAARCSRGMKIQPGGGP